MANAQEAIVTAKAKKKAYNHWRYKNHKEKVDAATRDWKLRNREVVRDFLWDYLERHPCVDCGESRPECLEFDHRDRTHKRLEISKMSAGAHKLDTVKKEVAKCSVRCANCHRIKTASEGGFWRSGYIKRKQRLADHQAFEPDDLI